MSVVQLAQIQDGDTARGNALAVAADEALREAQTQTGRVSLPMDVGLQVAQRHAARKNSGSRAENDFVRVQSKGVWKHGWDAGALALRRNLRVTPGSFRSCALSCAERDRVARETG